MKPNTANYFQNRNLSSKPYQKILQDGNQGSISEKKTEARNIFGTEYLFYDSNWPTSRTHLLWLLLHPQVEVDLLRQQDGQISILLQGKMRSLQCCGSLHHRVAHNTYLLCPAGEAHVAQQVEPQGHAPADHLQSRAESVFQAIDGFKITGQRKP